jgi:hypothetical protein
MLVLAMTLAVLAALGLYALKAASTEVKTSGYSRQSAQSQYMSEYGVLVSTQSMGGSLGAMQLGAAVSSTEQDKLCMSLQGIDLLAAGFRSQACRRVGSDEMQNTIWKGSGVKAVEPYTPNAKTGSMGPFPIAGDYFVEITDPACAYQAPGYSGGNFWFTDTTLTSYGRVEPDILVLPTLTKTQVVADMDVNVSRAHILAGPFSNTSCGTQ